MMIFGVILALAAGFISYGLIAGGGANACRDPRFLDEEQLEYLRRERHV